MKKSDMALKSMIVKSVLILIFSALFYGISSAEWVATYGGSEREYINSIKRTSDGGFIAAGDSLSYGGDNVWVLKLKSDGSIDWQNTYGSDETNIANAIQQTSDGGYIVAGVSNSFSSGGDEDGWVLKLDNVGNVVWQKTFGGPKSDVLFSIKETTDGYIAVGVTSSDGAGAGDVWVLKLDADGSIQWQKVYGGSDDDKAYSVQVLSDGYAVAGVTHSFGSGVGTNASGDAWILRLDTNGEVVWQKAYGGSGFDAVYSIEKTTDGGFVAAGETSSFGASPDHSDLWVFKVDKDGNPVWNMTYGGDFDDWATDIRATSDGGYIVAGQTFSFGSGASTGEAGDGDAWVIKLGSDGAVQTGWPRIYGSKGFDIANSVEEVVDGGVITGYVIGGATQLFNIDSYDAMILRVSAGGDVAGCSAIVGDTANIAGVSVTPTVTNTAAAGASLKNLGIVGTATDASPDAIKDDTRQEICSTDSSKHLYMLTVSAVVGDTGAGNGSVVSTEDPPLIKCGIGGSGNCAHVYNTSGIVRLQAKPEVDPDNNNQTTTIFAGWSGVSCSKKKLICDVYMTESKNITATFNIKMFSIRASSTKGGTIIPAGQLAPVAKMPINYGGQLKYTITPDEGYEISSVKINGNIIDTAKYNDNTYKFMNVTANQKIFVAFALKTFNIKLSVIGNGKILPSSKNGVVTVKYGKNKAFVMKPGKNYQFSQLKVDDQDKTADVQNNRYTISGADSDHTLEATFVPKTKGKAPPK